MDIARSAIEDGNPEDAEALAKAQARRRLQPVINATGVLLHTNLGRAPLPIERGRGYRNLELDLETGQRGSRSAYVAALLARLVGAEAVTVVNNGAAAVLLALRALAHGCGVAVSRGELVEIGGGFRIPDVMAESGATLVEVGTTNKTRRGDYVEAIDRDDPAIAAILKVHQSNFVMTGFTESVPVDELVSLDRHLVVDLGSGLVDSRCPWLPGKPPRWLAGEPGVFQTLASGADLVTFSGDKLLGGPQAGIIAGRSDLVAACASQPLARAVRPGGHVLELLQQVALAYLDGRGTDIPLWRMAATPVAELRERAAAIAQRSRFPAAVPGSTRAVMGGGTLPGTTIESWGIYLPEHTESSLRAHTPSIVARIEDRQTVLDLRTVDPLDDELLTTALGGLASP